MEELVTCEGTVHSIIFQNAENGYTVLRLLTEEGEVITVAVSYTHLTIQEEEGGKLGTAICH